MSSTRLTPRRSLVTVATTAALALAACGPSKEHAHADSAQAAMATEQARLATQLAAQKDSLTRVVLEADELITHIDSAVSKVRGMPKAKRGAERNDPRAQQIENRKLVLERVDALVARARATASQLAAAQKDNKALRAKVDGDEQMIAELGANLSRKSAMIDTLSFRIDSLGGVTRMLGDSITNLASTNAKAYYVIGKEDDLLKKGIIVREGGERTAGRGAGREARGHGDSSDSCWERQRMSVGCRKVTTSHTRGGEIGHARRVTHRTRRRVRRGRSREGVRR